MIKRLLKTLYEKNRFLRSIVLKLGIAPSLFSIEIQISSSRFVEYPWVLSNLKKGHQRILDVGSVGSTLPVTLACQGYEVFCIDIRPYEYANLVPNLHSVVGDIRQTDFKDEFFDCVIAVSTIEHIGIGRYGDLRDEDGDLKAVIEIKRILKKGGTFLLTVPYGRCAITPMHRVYDKTRLYRLVRGFHIENMQYFLKDGDYWRPSSESELSNIDSSIAEKGIVCLKLKKPMKSIEE